jgi:hypothetical protein
LLVEEERMEVDVSAHFISKHEPRRESRVRPRVSGEAHCAESRFGVFECRLCHREVEIRVWAGLLA